MKNPRLARRVNLGRQFPQFVVDVRRSLGMSQLEFSEALGVACSMVGTWETGKHVPHRKYVSEIGRLANGNQTWRERNGEH